MDILKSWGPESHVFATFNLVMSLNYDEFKL